MLNITWSDIRLHLVCNRITEEIIEEIIRDLKKQVRMNIEQEAAEADLNVLKNQSRTPEISLEDFKDRAIEVGMVLEFEQQKSDPNRYDITDKTNPLSMYQLLGLAHYFCNRKWAKDITYMYIMKTYISLTFTDESD